MESVNIFYLHGFIGRPNDWDNLIQITNETLKNKKINHFKIDYLNEPQLLTVGGDLLPLTEWGGAFNEFAGSFVNTSFPKIQTDQSGESLNSAKNILVGYSLGGRLALHALMNNSSMWNKCVLYSTNPTIFANKAEREERRRQDREWADDFLNLEWSSLMEKWEGQGVFVKNILHEGVKGHGIDTQNKRLKTYLHTDKLIEKHKIETNQVEVSRIESHYKREQLAEILNVWSHANQQDMRQIIQKNKHKITMLFGELDHKYIKIAHRLKDEKVIDDFEVIKNISHRIIFSKSLKAIDIFSN